MGMRHNPTPNVVRRLRAFLIILAGYIVANHRLMRHHRRAQRDWIRRVWRATWGWHPRDLPGGTKTLRTAGIMEDGRRMPPNVREWHAAPLFGGVVDPDAIQ